MNFGFFGLLIVHGAFPYDTAAGASEHKTGNPIFAISQSFSRFMIQCSQTACWVETLLDPKLIMALA
ncbi:hypothetical protein TH24_09905 [Thalassospira xiamenensis]|jgi:hypothetical protein|uniref:Uncharacterized protein n=2 Tax=Thalassospira TaxID=168934 RepID=A0AB72UBS9_9PROT|nr:hypothetical protein [Thalassospira sp. B30-1]AJD51723.1 hypothetical protein TH3_08025 [Thalassospira xiamenensis M-5 = DSM 17429]KEO58824.1 hypothetical protein SMB34_12465 [Thalassospira permensis NBRC 106175]QPL38200.1 hypothetical protein IT971_07775 [Thalassospira sp. B30-1]RCK40265.1 hypothetical protein TH24_09905 [Thalassospira xiamenensis]